MDEFVAAGDEKAVAQSVKIVKQWMLKAKEQYDMVVAAGWETVAHRALTRNKERLEWAADYLARTPAELQKQQKIPYKNGPWKEFKGLNA